MLEEEKYLKVILMLLIFSIDLLANNLPFGIKIEIRSDSDSPTAYVLVPSITRFEIEDTEVSITTQKRGLMQKGDIFTYSLKRLLPSEINWVTIRIDFVKLKLMQIDLPGAVIIKRKDHMAFGTYIVLDVPVDKISTIHYKALRITQGECYAAIIIVVCLIIAAVALLAKQKKIAFISFITVGLALSYWALLKLWQAF